MSRSYRKIKSVEHICLGPNNQIKQDDAPIIKMEKGNHLGELVVFTNCGYETMKNYCSLANQKNTLCKYFGNPGKRKINSILDSN